MLCLLCAAVFCLDMMRAQGSEGLLAGVDEENHLPRIMHVYRAMKYHPEGPLFDQSVDYWPNWWPPLTYWCGAQAFRFFGPSRQSAMVLMALFHCIIGLTAFGTVGRFKGPWRGLSAAAMTMLSPPIMYFAGVVGLDLGLTAMVGAAVLCLLLSEGFAKPIWSILFGVFCGLGMLAKTTFPIYVVPAALASLIFYRKSLNLRAWALVFVALVTTAAISSVWYFDRFPRIYKSLYFHVVDYQTKPDASFMLDEYGGFFTTTFAKAAGLGATLLMILGLSGAVGKRRGPVIILARSVLASVLVIAAAPANPERFLLPAVPLGIMAGCLMLAEIKMKPLRIAATALVLLLIVGASASRIYGAIPKTPYIFPPKYKAPVFTGRDELLQAPDGDEIPAGGNFCIFSESDKVFHEGYLRYLAQSRRPDLNGWVWGPMHFHHRQLEDFLNRLSECETVVFRTSRTKITRPDRQSVLSAVYLGEAHSLKQFDNHLAKGFFPKNYDIEKRLSESFAPFQYTGEKYLQINGQDEAARRFVFLERK